MNRRGFLKAVVAAPVAAAALPKLSAAPVRVRTFAELASAVDAGFAIDNATFASIYDNIDCLFAQTQRDGVRPIDG
jgi:hypothetical protein